LLDDIGVTWYQVNDVVRSNSLASI
jgi:hypothetical protein